MILFVLIALATAASQAYSDFRVTDSEARQITSAEYERCMSRSLHNEEAVQCIGDEWDHLDKLLNATYRTALAKASNARMRTRLRSDQGGYETGVKCAAWKMLGATRLTNWPFISARLTS
jgi:uncharacterized protein YecT (DUF1311 family)